MGITSGVVYIVSGEKYTQQALLSARSVKQYSPQLKVHLFTDQTGLADPCADSQGHIEHPHVRSKVDYLHQSPFDRTLYLDADTRIVSDITSVFDLLDRFDLAIAHAHQRNHFATQQIWRVAIPDSFPQMNGGVLLYNNKPATLQLLRDWQNAYHASSFAKDQVTLRELIWSSDLRITILPPEYNIRYTKYLDIWTQEEARPHILHLEAYKEKEGAVTEKKMKLIDKINWRLQKLKWIWKNLKSLG